MGTSNPRVKPLTQLETRNISARECTRDCGLSHAKDKTALPENVFHSMLALERRRAERSSKAFVLMLLDAKLENGAAERILKQAVEVVLVTKRETDLAGWYMENAILGVIFTGVNMEGNRPIMEDLRIKINAALIKHLGRDTAARIAISLHLFPEGRDKDHSGYVADSKLFPDLNRRALQKHLGKVVGGGGQD
jgi:hypothetical protein